MNLEKERIDILRAAVEQRERDVMHYQINIDNYTLAIAEIEANCPDLSEFAKQLQELLTSSLREQAKERLMLKVIKGQLSCT
jgi:hypothetical protein